MQSYTECIPCFVRQAYDALRQVTQEDEELVHRTLQRVMREAAEFPLSCTPPAMAQTTHRIIREESGNPDPYAAIKAESTRIALELAKEARDIIAGSIDPFKMALRFSIAGNIMDFALMANWDKLDLDSFIETTRLQTLDADSVEQLRKAVKQARSILFLGDNAGEAVFDKLLIEQFGGADVCYAVKGAPIINDVTLEDAKASGLDQVAELIVNGSDAPGTILEDCTDTFRQRFNEAELVIAKGQANYETLSTCTRPLFFLTRVKCPVIARDIGDPVGSWVVREHLVQSREVEGRKSPDSQTFDLEPSDLRPQGVLS
jgi:uncharacterized protein with ATP-grasp and redox domains